MKRDAEFFGERELVLIYMARRLKEALRLEDALSSAQIDYAVETGTYLGGLIFRRALTGAFFYVAPEILEQAKAVLLEHRFEPFKEG